MSLEDTVTMNVTELKKLLAESAEEYRKTAEFIERYSKRDISNLSRPEARGDVYTED